MQTQTKIYELKSDLLERKFRFWNSFTIVLYDDSIFVSKKELWGVNFEEKTFEIENIDSIYLKKKFNTRLFIFCIAIAVILFSIGDAVENEIVSLIALIAFVTGHILGFLGEKLFIIGSHNDKIDIRFSAVPRQQLDEIKTRVLDLKRKYKQSIHTNVSINNSVSQDNLERKVESGEQSNIGKFNETAERFISPDQDSSGRVKGDTVQEDSVPMSNPITKEKIGNQKVVNEKYDLASPAESERRDELNTDKISDKQDDIRIKLSKLKALYDEGVISSDEYEKLKGGILKDI